jgi:hypothetical protein
MPHRGHHRRGGRVGIDRPVRGEGLRWCDIDRRFPIGELLGGNDLKGGSCGKAGARVVPAATWPRRPPTDWGKLVQLHDNRDVFQASPDELPSIDIHSL